MIAFAVGFATGEPFSEAFIPDSFQLSNSHDGRQGRGGVQMGEAGRESGSNRLSGSRGGCNSCHVPIVGRRQTLTWVLGMGILAHGLGSRLALLLVLSQAADRGFSLATADECGKMSESESPRSQ